MASEGRRLFTYNDFRAAVIYVRTRFPATIETMAVDYQLATVDALELLRFWYVEGWIDSQPDCRSAITERYLPACMKMTFCPSNALLDTWERLNIFN